MKIKILAIAVTGILLSGCGNDDNGSFSTLPVQAYDPAVANMTATADCDGSTPEKRTTDIKGNANFTNLTAITAPETCKFTFVGGKGAIDVSNGKSMEGVTYIIPKGLASLNAAAITATPISTLIAKKLNGAPYNKATATEVMTDLGLGELLNNGDIDVTTFLLNTESVMKSLETKSATAFSQLSAVTAVLSDVLKTDGKATGSAKISVNDIAKASKALAKAVIVEFNNYPKSKDGQKSIYLEFDDSKVKNTVNNPNATIVLPKEKDAKKVVKLPSTTGGTGVIGTNGNT